MLLRRVRGACLSRPAEDGMTTPKLLTKGEVLSVLNAIDGGLFVSHYELRNVFHTIKALLPADGALPPIDKADEQIVDALVAKAQEGRTSRPLTPRQVTQTIEDLRGAVRSQLQRERDAAIARAEAAERRLAELKKRHGECSKCNGHGETQDAVISGQFYMCSDCDGSGSALLRSHILEAEETKSEVEHYRARAEAAEKRVAELEAKHEADLAFGPYRYAAGIREGLTRAAVACQDIGANPTAHADTAAWCYQRIVKLKEQVK